MSANVSFASVESSEEPEAPTCPAESPDPSSNLACRDGSSSAAHEEYHIKLRHLKKRKRPKKRGKKKKKLGAVEFRFHPASASEFIQVDC